jgi:hypothetical protein
MLAIRMSIRKAGAEQAFIIMVNLTNLREK